MTVDHSPRIRGDGPAVSKLVGLNELFSPYSRGWSLRRRRGVGREGILPVFAGMVPGKTGTFGEFNHSPRIRGDGPSLVAPLPH